MQDTHAHSGSGSSGEESSEEEESKQKPLKTKLGAMPLPGALAMLKTTSSKGVSHLKTVVLELRE